MLFRSRAAHAPEVGSRFRATQTAFGGHVLMVWTVSEIYQATDSNLHALLISSTDRTMRKTVAVGALTDPRLYRPIEE